MTSTFPSTLRLTEALGHFPLSPVESGRFLIGVLPGEGVGPEVIDASLHVLSTIEDSTDYRFELRQGGKIGTAAQKEGGRALTEDVIGFCASVFDEGGAILCGPGGGRFVYDLRTQFDLYCKLVPLQPFPALRDTGVFKTEALEGVDMLVIRENTGGLYQGEFGVEEHASGHRAYQCFHYDESQVRRILQAGIQAAQLRKGRLCVITKPGGAPTISQLWQDQARTLTANEPITVEYLEVDTACYQLLADARRFDVVVAPNMFGDVLADGATLLLGSRGMSVSANFSSDGKAVYQTGHGAAHDLAGTDRANPIGQIQSLALMMRESFGLNDLCSNIMEAINDALAAGWRTSDIMAPGCKLVGTREMGRHIAEALAARNMVARSSVAA